MKNGKIIKRLRVERAELAYKISKLKCANKDELGISDVQWNMMQTQLEYMQYYKDVLKDRIEDLK